MKAKIFLLLLVLGMLGSTSAVADESPSDAGKSGEDSLFGEDGSYNVSVDGAGVTVHREFDKDGKPKSGKGSAGEQAVEAVDRGFHKDRKRDRRERKKKLREEKEKAKDARR